METTRIRQLSVETVTNIPDTIGTNFISMIYTVGAKRPFVINGERIQMTISDIIQGDKFYTLYITNKEVTKKWMKIPVNERATVYYFLD